MERSHPAIRQWLTERRRELARNRIAQSVRRSAEAAEGHNPRERPAQTAGKPRPTGAS